MINTSSGNIKMPVLVGRYFECKIWTRKPNSGQYEDVPTTFRAKIVNDQTMNRNQPMQGILARATSMVIETIDLDVVNIQDKVQVLGDNFQVERVVTKKTGSPYTLGASKKTTDAIKKTMPKVIYLV
jgi:hypothetical protein